MRRLRTALELARIAIGNASFRLRQIIDWPISFPIGPSTHGKLYPVGQISRLTYVHAFENTDRELLAEFVKPGMTAIDVGANVGLYSVVLASLVSADGKVIAFEPSGKAYLALLRNLALNAATQVVPINSALGEKPGILRLGRQSGRGDGEKYLVDEWAGEVSDVESVSVVTLDATLSAQKLPNFDVMKIDVEGAEILVFRGAERALHDNPKTMIIFECTDILAARFGSSMAEVFTLLSSYGFVCHAFDQKTGKWVTEPDAILATHNNIWACAGPAMLPRNNG